MIQTQYAPWGIQALSRSRGALLLATGLGLLLFLCCDILGSTPIGTPLSIILFVFALSLLRKRLLSLILLYTSLAFYEFPRGIVDLYYDEAGYTYSVLSTTKLLGLSLTYWIMIAVAMLGIVRHGKKIKAIAPSLPLPTFLILTGLVGLVVTYFQSGLPPDGIKYIQMDAKLPLMVIAGIIIGYSMKNEDTKKDLAHFFILFPMILGIRAFLAMALDMTTGEINLDAGTRGLFSGITIAYILWTGEPGWYRNFICRILLFINLISVARGEMAEEAFLIFIGLAIGFIRHRRFAVQILLELLVLLAAALTAIAVVTPKLLEFIVWKASDFMPGQELSGSGQVRIEEIRNIIHLLSQNPLTLLFGQGFGAHFRFDWRPFPQIEQLDLNAYSADQISSGNIYTPHSFLGYTLLKFGMAGVFIYLWLPIRALIWHWKKASDQTRIFIPLLAILFYSYFWRPSEALLIGVLLGLTLITTKSEDRTDPTLETE